MAYDVDGPKEGVDWAVQVADDFDDLTPNEKEIYKFGKLPPEPFCRECGLCILCPEGFDIPIILRLPMRVNDCTECERKCPYHLPVIRMLKEVDRRLG